ncbi:MAG: ATP-dependent helicase, partial [Deltaproteobacteria bacterium]|nr:ATP-dependent helicase [Deltaproteobacteria bacterium]
MAIDYKKLLNPSQYKAVTHQGGPLLIVAGAGSGKTKTLVHRVAALIDQGFEPQSLLLLTFTRKAAQEMLARSAELVGSAAGRVAGGTFHSLAHSVLRKHAPRLGLSPSFTVMDQDDAESLIGLIRKGFLPDSPSGGLFSRPDPAQARFPQKGTILNILSQAINRQKTIAEVIQKHAPHLRIFVDAITQIGAIYREEKTHRGLLDFDDLLVLLVRLLALDEEARKLIAGQYSHVLVDEYQDTNPLQARLTYLLGRDHRNVTAVGDEAQAIYSFRGASFQNIFEFPRLFPGTTIVTLEANYRSFAPILDLANKVIAGAKDKYDKKLTSFRGKGPLPFLHAVTDVSAEAQTCAQILKDKIDQGVPLEDMAVLFRNSGHSFELEVALNHLKIPFTKYGGRKFLESAHVKSYLSLLRASVNPGDGISLKRIVGELPGFGAKYAEDVTTWVGSDRQKLARLHHAPVSFKLQENLGPLAELMAELIKPETLVSRNEKTRLALDYAFNSLVRLFPDDFPSRREELIDLPRMLEGAPTLEEALSEISLDPPAAQGQGRTPQGRPLDLTLSTIHSAKGLEWRVVLVLSLTEGRFPGPYCKSLEASEEERRLLYVAVTRAADELRLFAPITFGEYVNPRRLNRFLVDLDDNLAQGRVNDQKANLDEVFGQFADPADFSGQGGYSLYSTNPTEAFNNRPKSSNTAAVLANRSVAPTISNQRAKRRLAAATHPKNAKTSKSEVKLID